MTLQSHINLMDIGTQLGMKKVKIILYTLEKKKA
jgi:hypothetical protein